MLKEKNTESINNKLISKKLDEKYKDYMTKFNELSKVILMAEGNVKMLSDFEDSVVQLYSCHKQLTNN